jgi:3-methylcrotonyl-CoA carboxylase alpha subunit
VIRLLCGDAAFDLDVRGLGEDAQVTVGGQALSLQVEAIAPGVFLSKTGDGRQVFHCVRDGDVVHLFWAGRVYRLEEETEARRASHRPAAASGLEAPMPGKVIAVKVAPGDTVSKGDELLVVEAMKMENAVRAPRAGRVKAVHARVGEMVSPGVVLVELE